MLAPTPFASAWQRLRRSTDPPAIRLCIIPALPDRSRRPLAAVLLAALIPAALGWLAPLAGWPREQVLITGNLAATVLLWIATQMPGPDAARVLCACA